MHNQSTTRSSSTNDADATVNGDVGNASYNGSGSGSGIDDPDILHPILLCTSCWELLQPVDVVAEG